MATTTFQLYDALKAAGVEDRIARAAAESVLTIEDKEHLATKADLAELKGDLAELKAMTKADLAELKADLIKWNAGLLVAMTAIFAAIVKLL